MYQTNQKAWDETRETAKNLSSKMFGQDNLIGLTNEQRELLNLK